MEGMRCLGEDSPADVGSARTSHMIQTRWSVLSDSNLVTHRGLDPARFLACKGGPPPHRRG